jgi:cation diffusion facilitator CzcD-associated flavoprotein CzcO
VGLLASAPYAPSFPGAQDFQGETFHTGTWPAETVDFAGKRVGVIGTGSTGVQIIPELARQAEHLTVFQRTPQFTVPAQHHTVDAETLREIKANYAAIWEATYTSVGGFPWQHNGRSALDDTPEQREATFRELWAEGGFRFVFGSYKDLLTNLEANGYVAEFVRARIRERVHNDEVRERLVPQGEPFAARRPIVDTNYFETYDLDNVELVDLREESIERLAPAGLLTTAREYPLDMLVYATGFDAVSGPFLRIDVKGSGGLSLAEAWNAGPRTYLGLGVAGFPNLFTITGPGSAFGNIPVVVQHHVDWIATAIEHLLSIGATRFEVDEAAQGSWYDELVETAEKTVIPLADSWYSGANVPGKPHSVSFYLGSYSIYRRRLDATAEDGYPGFTLS